MGGLLGFHTPPPPVEAAELFLRLRQGQLAGSVHTLTAFFCLPAATEPLWSMVHPVLLVFVFVLWMLLSNFQEVSCHYLANCPDVIPQRDLLHHSLKEPLTLSAPTMTPCFTTSWWSPLFIYLITSLLWRHG